MSTQATPTRRRSSAVKRIMQELKELSENQSNDFRANPLDDNLFEWHFTIRGPLETEFHGGVYHGRIMLPSDYPFKPPDLMMLTPSGRFEIGKKICLSISGYHPEHWQPSWSIRTVLVALIAFMPSDPQGAIGSLNYSKQERRAFARQSVSWSCPGCGSSNSDCFADLDQLPPSTPITGAMPSAPSTVVIPDFSPNPTSEANPGLRPQGIHLDSPESNLRTEVPARENVVWSSLIIILVTAIFAILVKKTTLA